MDAKPRRAKILQIDVKNLVRSNLITIAYVASSSALLVIIVALQSYRYGIFGTGLLLGWDSPGYVWLAQDVIKNGPFDMMIRWGSPQLYLQLLSLLGYLIGNVVTAERILPIFFGILLICASYQLVLKMTMDFHIAGLAALLTTISLNFLRLLADLHRNLMAFSLVIISFLLVGDIDNEKSFLSKRRLVFLLILFVIAGTHFETYFILSVSLVLYGFLTRKMKNIFFLTLACLIPVVVLMSLFPAYFLSYSSTVFFLEQGLTFDQLLLWTGGAWLSFVFFVIGTLYLSYRAVRRDNNLALLMFSFSIVIAVLGIVIGITHVLPIEFAVRGLFLLPAPILIALSIFAIKDVAKRRAFIELKLFSAKKSYFTKISAHRLSQLITIVSLLSLLVSSMSAAFFNVDIFLTPYAPTSGYDKILMASKFLKDNELKGPVVVYYGDPAIWYASLYRNYFGEEIGEHFSYYGKIEDLLSFIPSEPKFKYDPSLMEKERYYSSLFYSELLGNWSGLAPFWGFSHSSYIPNAETLMSHPILIVAPELYNEKIPYFIRQFHISSGIYIIPPDSLLKRNEIVYGSSIMVQRNGLVSQVRSEYLYADPEDPRITVLRVNGSSGYESYSFASIPSTWTFVKIEQGNDLSFPEKDPKRPNGISALAGNDPADYVQGMSTLQRANIQLDEASKKEGLASLKVTGLTDISGNLGVMYNMSGTWDLSNCSLLEIWGKSTKEVPFCVTFHDSAGQTRTYWSIQVDGLSATVEWKRFVIDLMDFTSQTSDFEIGAVDAIDFFVWSKPDEQISLWIDDLTIDDFPNLASSVNKWRVLGEDDIIVYFAQRDEV